MQADREISREEERFQEEYVNRATELRQALAERWVEVGSTKIRSCRCGTRCELWRESSWRLGSEAAHRNGLRWCQPEASAITLQGVGTSEIPPP